MTEFVAIPKFVAAQALMSKNQLADLLFVKPGTSERLITVKADPLGLSTQSVERLVIETTRGWMEEHLADAEELDPASYLFDDPQTETVPTAWLEALYALPIHDDADLVMGVDEES